MLSGFTAKIAMAAIGIAVLVGAYYYVQNLENQLELAKVEVTRALELVERQEQHIARINESIVRIQNIQTNLFNEFNEIEETTNELKERFNESANGEERSFEELANQRPGLVEPLVNQGTRDALRCNEIVTGSPLTETEQNEQVRNSICPELLGTADD